MTLSFEPEHELLFLRIENKRVTFLNTWIQMNTIIWDILSNEIKNTSTLDLLDSKLKI